MPYFRELKEKVTHAKETEVDNAGQVFQRVRLGSVGVSPSDEKSDLSAGSNNDRLFAFIRSAHLEEAQEFRLKGYNSQMPEVDGGLLAQLRDGLAAARARLCLQTSVGGALGSLWLLDQIGEIERLTRKLSDDVIKLWVNELPRKSGEEAAESELGSRRTAQSLVRRLESTLQTLMRVVYTLRAIDDYSTSEKRHDMLVTELASAFSSSDKSTVIQALGRMTAETSGHAAWTSLMQARAAAWKAGKSASVDAMIAISRHEAEKANKKARELRGDPQTFFSHVAAYLQSFSSDLTKASINAGQGASSPAIPHVNNDETTASLSRSNSLTQRIKTDFDKKKLQAQIVVAGVKVYAHRLARIIQHGHPSETPTKDPEHVVADSIIRSILWQWQQPAIKIQYACAALLSKVGELKKIEGILASYAVVNDRGSEQERRNTTVSHPGEDDLDAQVREWVNDGLEQENTENQRAAKVATLELLLGGDIDHAQSILARLGSTTDSIQKELERQLMSVNDMLEARLSVDIARSLWTKVDNLVDKFMPDMARGLATAAQALNDATLAAGNSARNFSEAKVLLDRAQLLATKVKESLSSESARLTERPLDEHSRGARLAKHWATLAKEQNVDNYPSPNAQQVLAFLKKQELLVGIMSTGDPAGYLFATRLASELENAANNELRLPMSPEQYAALERGLVEYIVKWGQKWISRGGARIVIELSFEQALDTVSFNMSNLFRLPYKVLKASIKIPYQVNKVNNYIMPGHDKPYKAIYGLLGKKLKQLGFNLITAPAPGVIKLAAGVGITAGAVLQNLHVGCREKTFSAVYQHVMEGKQSEKIKMGSVKEMIFDSVLDTATTAAFKGAGRAWQSERSESNVISGNACVSKHVGERNKEMHPQVQRSEMSVENDNPAWENVAVNEGDAEPGSHPLPLQPQTGVKAFSDESDLGADQPRVRCKRAVEDAPPPSSRGHNRLPVNAISNSGHQDEKYPVDRITRETKFPPLLPGEEGTAIYLSPDRNYQKYALIWALNNNGEESNWVTNPDGNTHKQLNMAKWGAIDVKYNEEGGNYEISDDRVINSYITRLATMTMGRDEDLIRELERIANENSNTYYKTYVATFNSMFNAENIEKIRLKKQKEEENNRYEEALIEAGSVRGQEKVKWNFKKKHYDFNILRYLEGRGGEVDSAKTKSLWPNEIIIPHTTLKISLISVINGGVPKDIVALLERPETIDEAEWQGIVSGKLYGEIVEETDRLDEEQIEIDNFISKTERIISNIQAPDEYIRQWIKNNSNLEPDDTYTFYIKHPLPDRLRYNARVYKNQIDEFRRAHPDITKVVTVYDIITGRVNYNLNYTRSTNLQVDMPRNDKLVSLYGAREQIFTDYEKHLNKVSEKSSEDMDRYFFLAAKLNDGEVHTTSRWMKKLKENLNEIMYTETEIEANFGLSAVSEVIGGVDMFIPLSPLKGFVFITGSQVIINLLQIKNASSPEEKEMYRKAVRNILIYNTALSIPGIIVYRPIGRVGEYIRKGCIRITTNKMNTMSQLVTTPSRVTLPTTGAKSRYFRSGKESRRILLRNIRKKFNSESGMPRNLKRKRSFPKKFRIGQEEFLGKIEKSKFYISLDDGSTWIKGNKIHLAMYRRQNADRRQRASALFSNKIVIGGYAFNRVKYNQNKFNEMMRITKMYTSTSNSTGRIATIQQDYRTGMEMSHAHQYDHYNGLSLGEKLSLFNSPDTNAITRGCLAVKLNKSIAKIDLFKAAQAADIWKVSANKATDIVLVPQDIFLKGRAGESLSESLLMGWALQSGQDAKLARKLMDIYSSPNIADNLLYKSLVELHADGNASGFSAEKIPGVKVSALSDMESTLFLTENASVRVDIPEHTMLLSKVNQEGKLKYVFYDPNYGLAYFDKYKSMSDSFKRKLEEYNSTENSANLYYLDYSRLSDVKIKGRNLNEIINGEIPKSYRQECVNLYGISPHEGVYRMSGGGGYIKVNSDVYQVEWDQTMNTWQVFDPANTNYSRVSVPVKRDGNGEWFRRSDTGLKGGGLFDKIKNNWFSGKEFKRFTEVLESESNKWPPESINKDIHMIWIGTKNISEKNINLSIETARKNPDYNTTIIYDSGILGHESAKNLMAEKFKGSNVTLVDLRNKSYFNQLQQEPIFSFYEQVIRDNKYAQASDILRLLVLKFEGGIYKDIDDVQVKGFGAMAFPKGIGVMREYSPEVGKATAFPNTPIAATKNNLVINRTLEIAVENYRCGETNVLKLAGPDVFTEALYQEIPGMRPQVLNQQLEQFELAKRQALRMPLEKPKNFADEQLTLQEKSKISRPFDAIRGLSGYVDNGADHSWAADMPSTSSHSRVTVPARPPSAPSLENMPPLMRIGKLPVTPGPSTAPRAVTPQAMTMGLIEPKPLSGISDVGAKMASERTKISRYNGLVSLSYNEIRKDSRINSLTGLDVREIRHLNEAWSLKGVNIRNKNFDENNAVGSSIDVTFTIEYNKLRNNRYIEMPPLQWKESIDLREGDSKWHFQADMYENNPKSMTFFPWRNRYVEAYNSAKAKDKSLFNGNVKIYKKNMGPVGVNDIKSADTPIEKVKNIQKFLSKNGGVLEITITDVPQILKRENGKNKERKITFDIGFNDKVDVHFNQGICLDTNGDTSVFVTTSDNIKLARGDANIHPPEVVTKLRDHHFSPGEVYR